MANKQITVKMWHKTLRKLRFLHAYTGVPMAHILDRLVEAELVKYTSKKIVNDINKGD